MAKSAKKTSKKSTATEVKTTRVGDVSITVQTFKDGKRNQRIYTVCRRQEIPKEFQRLPHTSFELAHKFAAEIDLALKQKRVKALFEDENLEIRKINEELKLSKLLETGWNDQGFMLTKTPRWNTYLGKSTTLRDLFEAGKRAIEISERVNEVRKKAKMGELSFDQFFNAFEKSIMGDAKTFEYPTFAELIKERIEFKTGPNGGKGMTELEETSKREYRGKLGNLKNYIGIFKTGHDPDDLLRLVTTEGINKERNKTNPKKGELWSPRSRWKQASKIKEFGAWLVKIKKRTGWTENHFESLTDLYAIKRKAKTKTFKAKEVESLLNAAAADKAFHDQIPYLALSCFAGMRPYELGDPNEGDKTKNAVRRYDWANAQEWEIDSPVTGGKLIQVPAYDDETNTNKSKISYDRQADLSPNGFEWIKWWCEQKGTDLPTEGKVLYHYDTVVKIRKSAGLKKWIHNGLRHTAASMFHQNVAFKATDSYWFDACGHDRTVYKTHYADIKNPDEVKAYFNILPPKTK